MKVPDEPYFIMAYKILFGNKYFGRDIQECPSYFLMWCIEQYIDADSILIRECKYELSERLELDWQPPTSDKKQIDILKIKLDNSETEIQHLKDVIFMSIITSRWNYYTAEKYLNAPVLLQSDIKFIRETQ